MKFLNFEKWREERVTELVNQPDPYELDCPFCEDGFIYEDDSVCRHCLGEGVMSFDKYHEPTNYFIEMYFTPRDYEQALIKDTCAYDSAVNNILGKSLFDMGYQVYQTIDTKYPHLVRLSNA